MLSYDKPLNTIIVNLILDRLPDEMKDLYYFFVTTIPTILELPISRIIVGAYRNGGYQLVSNYLWMTTLLPDATLKLAIEEFTRLNIGSPETKILLPRLKFWLAVFLCQQPTTFLH